MNLDEYGKPWWIEGRDGNHMRFETLRDALKHIVTTIGLTARMFCIYHEDCFIYYVRSMADIYIISHTMGSGYDYESSEECAFISRSNRYSLNQDCEAELDKAIRDIQKSHTADIEQQEASLAQLKHIMSVI